MPALRNLLFTTILLFLPLRGFSCDVINGSDIKFEHLGGYKYHITFVLYHQCVCALGVMPKFTISCAATTLPIVPPRTSIKDITPVCSSGQPPCQNGGYNGTRYGIEEHIFEDTIDFAQSPYDQFLNGNCCEVMFRVAQPWGLVGTTTSTTTYGGEAMLNFCNIGSKGNNSPTISTVPMSFMCCNQPFTFNNGVFDSKDGDSLSFELVEPLSATFMPVTWISPLNKDIPLTPFCPPTPTKVNCRPIPNAKPPRGFFFDPETGDMVLTPTKCDESGPVAIKVTEFRKDSATKQMVKLGYVRRDIYVTVVTCGDNNPPVIEGNNKHSTCEGDKICFKIKGTDEMFSPNQTVPDTVNMTWNNSIPGATFTILDPKSREKEAEFCWTPAIGDARNQAYNFAVTAKDDACPRPAYTIKGFNIKVNPKARSERDYDILDCGKLRWEAHPADTIDYPISAYRYKFTIRDSTNSGAPYYISVQKKDSFKFKRGGKYIIEHEITNPPYNCPTVYSDTVIIPPVLEVNLAFGNDTFVCAGNDLKLKPEILNGVPSYKYKWESPVGTRNPKDTLQEYTLVKPTQTTRVVLELTDKNKCVDTDTIVVNYQPNPIVDIGPDQRICTYNSVILDAQNDDTMRYYWLPSGDSSRTIEVNRAGKYIAKVIDHLGCFTRDTMQLFVNDTVIAIATPHREICIYDTLKVSGARKPVGYPRSVAWKDINTGLSLSNDSFFKSRIMSMDDRQYDMRLEVNQGGVVCVDNDTLNLKVNALPTFNISPPPPRCFEEGAINLTLAQMATAKSGDGSQSTVDSVRYFQKFRTPSWVTGGPRGVNSYVYDFPKFTTNAQIPSNGIRDTICFDYRDYKGCYNSECQTIRLYGNPIVELKEGTFCQRAGLITLDKLVLKPFSKVGGIQSFRCLSVPLGSGVDPDAILWEDFTTIPSTHKLDPGIEGENQKTGVYEIEYCFRNALTGCESCDTTQITVVKLPEIQFDVIPKQCINFPLLHLDSFVKDRNTGKRFADGYWKTVEYGGSRNMNNPNTANKINNSIIDEKDFDPTLGAGSYLVKLTDTSSGCPVSDSTTVTVNGLPRIEIQIPDTVCSSSAAFALNNIMPAGAVGTWSGEGVNNREFDPSISAKSTQYEGPYQVKFAYTNPLTGCSASDSQTLLIQSQPEASITTPKPYQQCEGIIFDIQSQKEWAQNVIWTSNGDGDFMGTEQNLDIKYQHGTLDTVRMGLNGNVRLTIHTRAEGVCPIASDSIPLIIEPYPQFDFTADDPIQCEPASVNFEALVVKPAGSANLRYTWDFGNMQSLQSSTESAPANILYDTAKRDWYTVTLIVENQWGANAEDVCEVRKDSFDYIKVLPQPKAAFSSNPPISTTVAFPKFIFKNETEVRWKSPGYMTYTWHFGIGAEDDTLMQEHPTYIYPADTNKYWVNLISQYNLEINQGVEICFDSTGQKRIIDPDVTVFVPNAFTPDGSGPEDNNVFRPIVNGETHYFVQVYNRWGELLWETEDKYLGWDGLYNGQKAPQGVYVWHVKVKGYDGEDYTYEGTVTLLR